MFPSRDLDKKTNLYEDFLYTEFTSA
jgi:hypothetical protein